MGVVVRLMVGINEGKTCPAGLGRGFGDYVGLFGTG